MQVRIKENKGRTDLLVYNVYVSITGGMSESTYIGRELCTSQIDEHASHLENFFHTKF